MCWIIREDEPEGEYRLAVNASDQQRLFGKGYFYLAPVLHGQEVILPTEPAERRLFDDNRELIGSLRAQLQQSNARFACAKKGSGYGGVCAFVASLMALDMSLGPIFLMIMVITDENGFNRWGNFIVVILVTVFSSMMLVVFIVLARATYLSCFQQKQKADWLENLATIVRNENEKWSALRVPHFLRLTKAKRCGLVYISFTTVPLNSSELNEWQEAVLQLREQAKETEAKLETLGTFLNEAMSKTLCFPCVHLTLRDEVPEGEYRLLMNATDEQEVFGRGYACDYSVEIPDFGNGHGQLLACLAVKLQEAKSNYESSIQRKTLISSVLLTLAIVLLCIMAAALDQLGVHIISKLVIAALIFFCILFGVFQHIVRHKFMFWKETSKWIEEVVAITNDENQNWSHYQMAVVQTRCAFFYISFTPRIQQSQSYFRQDHEHQDGKNEASEGLGDSEQEVDEYEPSFMYTMQLNQAVSIV